MSIVSHRFPQMSLLYLALVLIPYAFGAAVYSAIGLLAAWTYRDFIRSTAQGVPSNLSFFARVGYRVIWMTLRVLLAHVSQVRLVV